MIHNFYEFQSYGLLMSFNLLVLTYRTQKYKKVFSENVPYLLCLWLTNWTRDVCSLTLPENVQTTSVCHSVTNSLLFVHCAFFWCMCLECNFINPLPSLISIEVSPNRVHMLPAFLGFVSRQQGVFQNPHLMRKIQKIPKCFFCNSGAVFACVIDCDDLGEHREIFVLLQSVLPLGQCLKQVHWHMLKEHGY